MDMDATFVEAIKKLSQEAAKPEIVEIDGRKYYTKSLTRCGLPEPESLHVNALTAVMDYLNKNPDGLILSDVTVLVDNPTTVRVLSTLQGAFQQRCVFLTAQISGGRFRFGTWYNIEEFNIALQSMFVQDETTETILKIVGNVTDGTVTAFSDDGISQQVQAKAGVARVANVPVPNPVVLQPFRTFSEVKQPASKFIFRMKSGADSPLCALYEADGGAWAGEAITNVKGWLADHLPENVTVLA
jgi:hypothetical protein